MKQLFFFLIIFTITITTGCYEVPPTTATIEVVRRDNGVEYPINGAEVRLYAMGSTTQSFIGQPRFDTLQYTNSVGIASFNFSEFYKVGQTGFVVLDVSAKKGSLEGNGLIQVLEMQSNKKKIVIE